MSGIRQFFNVLLYPKKASAETISGLWIFRNSSADATALVGDVTQTVGSGIFQEWRVNNTAVIRARSLLTIPGFFRTDSNGYLAMGFEDLSNFFYFDGLLDKFVMSGNTMIEGGQYLASNYYDLDLAGVAPGPATGSKWRRHLVSENGIPIPQSVDPNGLVIKESRDRFIVAKNSTGSSISKGSAVALVGTASATPNVILARANSTTTMPAAGLALESISDGAYGKILVSGQMGGLNTGGFNVDDIVYISHSTAGAFKSSVPVHPNFQQPFAKVLVKDASAGIIELIDNWYQGNSLGSAQTSFTIGDASSSSIGLIYSAGSGRTLTLRAIPTGVRTLTLPDATDTLIGRSTTDTLINKTLTGNIAANFSNSGTITLPSTTDTLVGRATTDTLTNKTLTSPTINTPTITTPTITGSTTGEDANFNYPSTMAYIRDDFTGNATTAGDYSWSTQASGAGAAVSNVAGEQNHPGIRRSSTGTTAAGYAGINNRLTYIDPSGSDVYESIVRLSANTGIILRLGLQDTFTSADNADGYYFEFDPATSANWRYVTANNSTRTKNSSSTAVSAATWYRLKIVVNSANSSAQFFVNGSSIGTNSTNLPVSGRTFGISAILANDGVSTTNVDLDIDLIYWYNKNLTR